MFTRIVKNVVLFDLEEPISFGITNQIFLDNGTVI